MYRDPSNQYRPQLLTQSLPFPDRVDTPWVNQPDLATFNQPAYNRVVRLLAQMQKHTPTQTAQSQGLLILGEAGTGKTHLLMRVARQLSRDNYILFVPKPNNPHAVYLHVWTNTLQSLTRTVEGRNSTRSQLDDLLAHVFSAVLIPELEGEKSTPEHRRWAARLRTSPFNLFTMLGEGQKRADNLNALRNRTLRYLKTNHPEVDGHVAHALITYCLSGDANRQRALLTWLSGQDVLDDMQLGLPHWGEADTDSNHQDVAGRREDMALKAIRSLAILSTYYQPLILAFDQLEGLRHQPEVLTLRWADAVREIVTQLPNLLVITCVFPSLWETWFTPRIEASASQRIAAHKVELETFTPRHAKQMLGLNLDGVFRQLHLPSPIYPFEDVDVESLCPPGTSPRQFIQGARDRFNGWLDGAEDLAEEFLPPSPPPPAIDQVLGDAIQQFRAQALVGYARGIPIEEDLYGRVENLVSALLMDRPGLPPVEVATRNQRVMPLNFIVEGEDGHRLCFAVLNSTGRSATSRLENLLHVAGNTGQFDALILVRDRRCPLTTTSTVAHQHLRALQQQGCVYLLADRDEVCRLDALYDALGAVEQGDLSVGNEPVERMAFVRYVRNRGVARETNLFSHAGQKSQLFHEVLGVLSPVNTAPMQTAPGV